MCKQRGGGGVHGRVASHDFNVEGRGAVVEAASGSMRTALAGRWFGCSNSPCLYLWNFSWFPLLERVGNEPVYWLFLRADPASQGFPLHHQVYVQASFLVKEIADSVYPSILGLW